MTHQQTPDNDLQQEIAQANADDADYRVVEDDSEDDPTVGRSVSVSRVPDLMAGGEHGADLMDSAGSRVCVACGLEVERFSTAYGSWWDHVDRGAAGAHRAVVSEQPAPAGPAASETPQDAREVERRDPVVEAAYQEVFRLCEGGRWQMSIPYRADRDSDALIVAGLDALVAQRDALQRDLAQAVRERDRLRAGIEGIMSAAQGGATTERARGDQYRERHWLDVCILAERLLATPDADAQDEGVRRG